MVFCFCAGKGKLPLPDKVILAQKREISILKIGKKNTKKHNDFLRRHYAISLVLQAFPDTFQFEALFHTIYRYETVNYGLHLLLYPIQ